MMKYNHGNMLSMLLFLSVLVLSVTLSCSRKAVDPYYGDVAVNLHVQAPAGAEAVDMYILTVSAPDMETITAQLDFVNGLLVGEILVPAGRNRTFVLEAIDSKVGLVLYRGSTVANVVPDRAVNLRITLRPVVPMLRISPRMQRAQPLEYFTIVVEAYNLPELRGAAFRIGYDFLNLFPIEDSTRLGRGLSEEDVIYVAQINHGDIGAQYAIGMSVIDNSEKLVDASGFAELMEIQFGSPFFDTVAINTLALEITGLWGADGAELPLEGVFSDSANVEISLNIANDTVVTFPDPELDSYMREILYIPTGDIYVSDLYPIQVLWLGERGVSDITGLSAAVNLVTLGLEFNFLSDISELRTLPILRDLYLSSNIVADISPLADIKSLQQINLAENQISNIAPLGNLPYLKYLDLSYNLFTDLGPLVNNPGINDGDVIYLVEVPLSTHALQVQIPQLKARGVEVHLFYPM
ncbi:MAG: hypothetical protein JSV44_00880 [Candidatus Zixiibacteriota bacterium]|nr:MAG: hypothetical protein JSV44_00880 [candidate division Zixibacteria bacterium]